MTGRQMGGMGMGMFGQALSGQRINPNQFKRPMQNAMLPQGAPPQQAPNRFPGQQPATGFLGQMANQGAVKKPQQFQMPNRGGFRAY
jgi:hypothetical protein